MLARWGMQRLVLGWPSSREAGGWGVLNGVGMWANSQAPTQVTCVLWVLWASQLYHSLSLSVDSSLHPVLCLPPVPKTPERGWIMSALKKGKHLAMALTLTGVLGL